MLENDICIMCGEPVPEGLQICPQCVRKTDGESSQTVAQLRDIAATLNISAATDQSIKEAMESILSIADRIKDTGIIIACFRRY